MVNKPSSNSGRRSGNRDQTNRKMMLVPVSEIPRQTVEVATDDLLAAFRKSMTLQSVCLRENGIGLSAVQIGWHDRMFVTKNQDGSFRCFINTKYEPVTDEKFTSCEGCLSLQGRAFLVPRFKTVRIVGTEVVIGDSVTIKNVDFEEPDPLYSAVYQHEIDHTDGILISEIGKEVRVRPA